MEARKTAARRSGARGKDARAAEIRAEASVEEAEKRCVLLRLQAGRLIIYRVAKLVIDDMWATKANELLSEVQLALELVRPDLLLVRSCLNSRSLMPAM